MIKTLILCLLLLSHQVFAGDYNFDDIVSISTGNDVVRSYITSLTANGFTSVGISIKGTITKDNADISVDTSVFSFDTGSFLYPSFLWAYYHGAVSGFSVSGSAFTSAFIPTYIIEYVETNNQNGFQEGADEVVGWVNLGLLEFTTTQTSETLQSQDGSNFKVYHVSSTSSTGLYQMNFTISGAPVSIGGASQLSAEQAKIDIGIYNYYDSEVNPATKADCDFAARDCVSTGASKQQSSLALVSFYGALQFDLDVAVSGQISVQNSDGFYAGFDWIGTAKVTEENGTVNVNANVHSNVTGDDGGVFGSASISSVLTAQSSHKFLVYSFDGVRASSIEWDPVMGGKADNNGIKIASSFGLILLFVLFTLLI